MLKAILNMVLFLLIAGALQAQEPVQQIVEDLIESTDFESDENIDIQEAIDYLTYFSQHPIAINKAEKEDLLKLHFLTELQIEDLLAFRKRTGQIYSIYEMAAIDGFDINLLQKLEPFLRFEINENAFKYKRSDNDIIVRATRSFNAANREKESDYEGSLERYYFRFKHLSNSFEYGIIAEKDPGESFFKGSNNTGFDYMGAFANVKLGASGQKVLIGDYRVSFGQGLVASQGFSMGKSAETTQVYKFGQGIRSSSSTEENQFFRGVAGQIKLGKINFSPFVSWRQLDANIDTIDDKTTFAAFQTSGYHRTTGEIEGKNSLRQLVGGANAEFSIKRWTMGFTAVFTQFNAELKRSEELSNQYLWEGQENLVAGMNWKGSIRNVFIFGEMATSGDKGKALLCGTLFKPAANAELTAIYRNINKTYFSFYSNSFTESSRTNDEKGVYVGLKYLPASSWILQSYVDIFKYQWIKYTTAAPSSGIELLAQLTFRPSQKTKVYARFLQEEKEVKVTDKQNKYNTIQKINRYRLNFEQQLNENISFTTRLELSSHTKLEKENGILLFQDIFYKPVAGKYSINGRLAWFSTDGYNSRLYAYENDLLYSFAFPAVYGKGIRAYLNLKHSFSGALSLWIKVSTEHVFSRSSTENTDEQATKYETKVQLRYQF